MMLENVPSHSLDPRLPQCSWLAVYGFCTASEERCARLRLRTDVYKT